MRLGIRTHPLIALCLRAPVVFGYANFGKTASAVNKYSCFPKDRVNM